MTAFCDGWDSISGPVSLHWVKRIAFYALLQAVLIEI
jgi:hypothetical protein